MSVSLFYNPSHGFIADLVESTLMKFTGTSGLGRQFAADVAGVAGLNIVAHSQGSLIVSNAMSTMVEGGLNFGQGTMLTYYGAASNRWVAGSLANATGAQFVGSFSHSLDTVGNVVGFNTLNPFKWVGSVLAFPSLFTSVSPHSGYP